MSRSSSEREINIREEMKRLSFYDKLMEVEKAAFVDFCESYAEQKIKQMFEEENRNEGDRFMPCSQCKREFEWNGKDKGELVRVRGGGMWCRSCLGGPYNV